MTRLRRASATARRAAARLLPAEHRDWAETLWAEAHEVPPGLPRLAWRAGGLRLIAREAAMARRLAEPGQRGSDDGGPRRAGSAE